MTPEDRDAIRARLAAATPGPWEAGDGWVYTTPVYDDDNRLSNVLGMPYADSERVAAERERGNRNADLIAHAPTDLAALLDALDEAERTLDRVLTNYAVCVSGEWGSCLNPKRRGWAEFFAEFKAEALRVEDDPWWADYDEEEDE